MAPRDPKDAEIARLKADMEYWHYEYREAENEIERLEEANKSITFEYLKAQGEIEAWKENERRALSLITELCDALDESGFYCGQGSLIQRARKATR